MFFLIQTLADILKMATSKKGIQQLFGISLYRNAFYLMLNSVAVAVTGFIFWAIAARLYPVEGLGFASAAISAMTLLALLSSLGLDYGLVRFLPTSGEEATTIMNSCFTAGSLVSIALSLIFVAGLGIWSPALLFIRQHPIFFVVFVISTTVSTLHAFVQRAFIAGRGGQFALAQGLIFGILRFIPLLFLANLFETFGIFVSWGMAMSLTVIVSLFLFLPRIHAGYHPIPAIRKRAIRGLMNFSVANYGANLMWTIPGLILPLMVVNRLGAEPNAYFYIGWATASVLFTIPVAISLSLFAEGSYNQQRLARDISRSLKLMFIILVPTIILIYVLGDKILLLFGRAYSENAIKLLRISAISALPIGINHLYFSIKRIEMKMKSVVGFSIFIAILTLVLSWFLMPRMGIWGAGVAWLSANGLVAVVVIRNLLQPIRSLAS